MYNSRDRDKRSKILTGFASLPPGCANFILCAERTSQNNQTSCLSSHQNYFYCLFFTGSLYSSPFFICHTLCRPFTHYNHHCALQMSETHATVHLMLLVFFAWNLHNTCTCTWHWQAGTSKRNTMKMLWHCMLCTAKIFFLFCITVMLWDYIGLLMKV